MEHAAEEAEEQKEDIRHKVKDAIPALVDIFREIDKAGWHHVVLCSRNDLSLFGD